MFGHGIDNAITSGYLAVLSIHDSNKATISYPLEEIYRYNLNMYIGNTLRKSVDAYNLLETNPDNFVNVLKQYV
jgi:flavin-dependent dehydrogenase